MKIDNVIKHYIGLRDRIAELESEHKKQLEPLRQDMNLIEAAIQKELQDKGVTQFKAGGIGTAFLEETTSLKVVDWDGGTLPWIVKHQAWYLLIRNVNKTAASETGDVPGLEWSKTRKVKIRRA